MGLQKQISWGSNYARLTRQTERVGEGKREREREREKELKDCLKLPLSDPEHVSSFTLCPWRVKLGSSMALLLKKSPMLPFSGRRWTRLLLLIWPVFFSFPFLSFPNLSPPSAFGVSDLFLCSVQLRTSPSSIPFFLYFCFLPPNVLSLSDEAIWRKIIFSIKRKRERKWEREGERDRQKGKE